MIYRPHFCTFPFKLLWYCIRLKGKQLKKNKILYQDLRVGLWFEKVTWNRGLMKGSPGPALDLLGEGPEQNDLSVKCEEFLMDQTIPIPIPKPEQNMSFRSNDKSFN